MKTDKKKNAAAQEKGKTQVQSFFVTVESSMNDESNYDDNVQDAYGYPDFYEDTDSMNRYLW